jgi:hypothetical protein
LEKGVCFAVVRVEAKEPNTKNAYPVIRFDDSVDELGHTWDLVEKYSKGPEMRESFVLILNEHNTGHMRPAGLYMKIPQWKGRARVIEKMGPLLLEWGPVTSQLDSKLTSRGIKAGDDVTVMVVNEGEIDLYLNFACSCQQHGISTNNVVVFAGSEEIVTIIEGTGAMGLYHKGYSHVSNKASEDYLDRVFVDMMWYKAFSIYLLLRKRINILFQDVDLVWFRDPFPYFHNYINATKPRSLITNSFIEGLFSDDGQRSQRYAPYYANSGFYYLVASPRSEHFAWSIMTAFDAVQRLGSHQNVFTTRLVEGITLSYRNAKILPMEDFPTGMYYHHNRTYMKRLVEKQVQPYGFHMCWTQGKKDKLIYLKKALMWYLTSECSVLDNLTPSGNVFGHLRKGRLSKWEQLASHCCTSMHLAP